MVSARRRHVSPKPSNKAEDHLRSAGRYYTVTAPYTQSPDVPDGAGHVLAEYDPRGFTPRVIREHIKHLDAERKRSGANATTFGPTARTRLVEFPSDLTRRAIEIVGEVALHHLLGIDAFSVDDWYAHSAGLARAMLVRNLVEAKRWRAVENHLVSVVNLTFGDESRAIARLKPLSSTTDGAALILPCDAKLPGPLAELGARDVLLWYAEQAARHAADAKARTVHARASRTPKAITATSRERILILEEKLKPHGWTRGTLADLILASERDWTSPPVELAPALRNRKTLVGRLNNLANPRSNRRR